MTDISVDGVSGDGPVLVTGATGFLGSRIAHGLVRSGRSVRVLVRRTSDRRRLTGLAVDTAEGDITDRASVVAALRGASSVIHSAALYELGTADVARMRHVNVDGTANVIESALAAGIPAVHVSSTVALGPTGDGVLDESHWSGAAPRSAYEATKREAHELVRRLVARGGRVRIAIPSTIYGPDDPSLVGRFHRLYMRGLIWFGAVRAMRMSLVHVDDCASGITGILDRGRDGEEYLVCSQVVRIDEWLATLGRVTGVAPPRIYIPQGIVLAFGRLARIVGPWLGLSRELIDESLAMSNGIDWAFSADKARRELGFAPRTLEEGLRETMAFYRAELARRRARR